MNAPAANLTRIASLVPGGAPVELVAWYPEFADYYPECELETKRWVAENIRPDWVLFDIGANVGIYAILFSRLAPEGFVHAFEPTATAGLLRRNFEFHQARNVAVHETALGNRTGRFAEPIYRIWGRPPETQTYAFTTLDDFVANAGIERLDCIKIDVDGFDLEVLMGGAETLQRFDPWVIVELNHALATRGHSPGEAMRWLLGQGYTSAFVLDDENFLLKRGSQRSTDPRDVLALRFDRRPVMLPPSFAPGEPVPDYFSDQPVLHNEASVERDVSGTAILVPGPRWSFAASWPRQPSAVVQGPLVIEVRVEVSEGAIGLGCLAADYRNYIGKEIFVAAAPTWQSVRVFAPESTDVAAFMLRNVSESGAPARARVGSIGVSPAVPAAPASSPLLEQATRSFRLPAEARRDTSPLATTPVIRIVPAEELGGALGFRRAFVPEKRVYHYTLAEFKTEIDEPAIFRFIYRNFQPARHLEFGTWEGWGVVLCAESCAARIWTINLPEGERDAFGAPVYSASLEPAPDLTGSPVAGDAGSHIGWRYKAAGFADRVQQILCDSRDFPSHEFAPGFFDTILIDGGHTTEVVTSDTGKALPLLRPGGLLMWHDFCPDPAVLEGSAAVHGVVTAIGDNFAAWRPQLSDLFWVRPSHLLIGVKA
ncbi:MAG: FkbM family methyltransferase [Acetobacteraceae bacterium]